MRHILETMLKALDLRDDADSIQSEHREHAIVEADLLIAKLKLALLKEILTNQE